MKFLLESNGLPSDTIISLDGKKIGFVERCIFKSDIETSKIFCRIGRTIPKPLHPGRFQTNEFNQTRTEVLKVFPELFSEQDKDIESWRIDFSENYLSKQIIIFSNGTIEGTKIFLYGKIIPGLKKFKIVMETGEPISVTIEQYILPNIKDRDLNYFRKEDFEKPTAIGKKKKNEGKHFELDFSL